MGGTTVTFFGVRGSTPCDSPHLARYGGNTSCVVIEAPGEDPVVLDMGTGLRAYGNELVLAGLHTNWRGSILCTHLHWDHVQGLPFFTPMHLPETEVTVIAPRQDEGELRDVFTQFMSPPFFPITPDQLGGQVRFQDAGPDQFMLGNARVTTRWIRHTGPTLGYRVEIGGASVVYISDHGPGCVPEDPDDYVPNEVLELCDGADLVIHDAQHTGPEYETKRHWGHCTVDYAVHVAREAGARSLALFHHDPAHGDEEVDRLLLGAQDVASHGSAPSPEVLASGEGMRLLLGAPPQPAAQVPPVPRPVAAATGGARRGVGR